MLEWYGSLDPDKQAAVIGGVVMLLVMLVRAIAAWSGRPLGETALAKLGNYLTVAAATAFATLLTTGAVPAFWWQWALALFTAVGSWEAISKTYKPLANAAATTKPLYPVGLLVLALVAVVTVSPLQAQMGEPATGTKIDEGPSPFSATIIAPLEEGPLFGGAISYQVARELWVDVGVKREDAETDEFLGASTDWPLLQKVLGLFGVNAPAILKGSRYGAGYLFESNDKFFYMARTVFEF